MAEKRSTKRSSYKVDVDWLGSGVEVEYQPRRTFGIEACDYQERVNYDRLRKERLQRLKDHMQKRGFTALFLNGLGENIRYATSTWDQGWRVANLTRYCVVPLKGDPILFETAGDLETYRMHCPWMEGRIRPAITYRALGSAAGFLLKQHVEQVKNCFIELGINLKEDKIGYDTMDVIADQAFKEAGVNMVPGMEPIIQARLIKTKDELELLKMACAMTDTCYWYLRNEWVKPGVTEKQVLAKIAEYLWSHNFQQVPFAVVATGGNTNPYHRAFTDRLIRQGDMVIIDLALLAFNGYVTDYVRCWPVDAKFTPEQKEAYKKCYNNLYSAIHAIKPGATSADVVTHFPVCVDDDNTWSGLQFAHSVGLTCHEGGWMSRGHSFDFPMPIEKNMYFAVETYESTPGKDWSVRLEENLVVTDTGTQVFSLAPFEEEALDGTPVGELIP